MKTLSVVVLVILLAGCSSANWRLPWDNGVDGDARKAEVERLDKHIAELRAQSEASERVSEENERLQKGLADKSISPKDIPSRRWIDWMCSAQNQINISMQTIAAERELGIKSGFVDASTIYNQTIFLEDSKQELARLKPLYKKATGKKFSPKSCPPKTDH